MNTNSFPQKTRLVPDDVIRNIEGNLPGVDTARAQGYSQLAILRDAKAASLSREQRLLAIKYGATHPRIAQAAAAFARNENFRREIAVVREAVETPIPVVDEATFVVYGFVRRRSTRAGIPCLTLALTDEPGNWLRQYGYACTDKRGYFELTIKLGDPQRQKNDDKNPGDLTDEEKKRLAEEKARAAATGAASPETGYSASDSTKSPSAILRVFRQDGGVLHTEKDPVMIKSGALDSRLILLGDDDTDCGCAPPPAKAGGKPAPTVPATGGQGPAAGIPPKPSAAGTPVAHVSDLKDYQQPPASGQPLEAIRGIGPKSADKLRAAGIPDVAALEKTPGQKLVDLAGFDKASPKRAASTQPGTANPVEKTPAPAAKPAQAPAKTISAKPAEKKISSKPTVAAQKKRPKK